VATIYILNEVKLQLTLLWRDSPPRDGPIIFTRHETGDRWRTKWPPNTGWSRRRGASQGGILFCPAVDKSKYNGSLL